MTYGVQIFRINYSVNPFYLGKPLEGYLANNANPDQTPQNVEILEIDQSKELWWNSPLDVNGLMKLLIILFIFINTVFKLISKLLLILLQ